MKLGTLFLVEVEDYGSKPNKKGEICKFPYGLNIAGDDDMGYPTIKPVIICDDDIKKDDYYIILSGENKNCIVHQIHQDHNFKWSDIKKVLVLPNQFSQEFLQLIVEGKANNGDVVDIEMIPVWQQKSGAKTIDHTNYSHYEDHKHFGEIIGFTARLDEGKAIIRLKTESAEQSADDYVYSFQDVPLEKRPPLKPIYDAFIAGAKWHENKVKKDFLIKSKSMQPEEDEYIVSEILPGTHRQFIFNEEKEKVECRCGHAAVWWRTGYVCGTITAYPCKF